MNIRQYASQLKKQANEDPEYWPSDFSVRSAFDQGGYHSVVLGFQRHREWTTVHAWCRDHIGEDHYTWTGSRFWFENEQDAVMFLLRWA